MKIEQNPVFLKLEYFLNGQAVNHSLQMNKILPLLRIRFKLTGLYLVVGWFRVIPYEILVYFVVERRIGMIDKVLSLLVKVFYLVDDLAVDILIKYAKDIKFFPYIGLDILKIFFWPEELPILKFFELFLLHDLFQPG